LNRIEVYSRQSDNTGEGPLWSAAAESLCWVDIGLKRLHCRAESDAAPSSWDLPEHPGCLAEIADASAGESLALAMGAGVHRFSLESGAFDLMSATPPRPSGTRFNDGKVDPEGRLWASTMENNIGPNGEGLPLGEPVGALYRFDEDGSVHVMEERIGCPNTLAWAPDGRRFYFGDSVTGRIWVYDFDPKTGAIDNRRSFFESNIGIPDGSAVDVDGCLWNARCDGGALLRITPEGSLDRVLSLPVPSPTSCAFGGRNLDILFVTSATCGMTREQLEAAPLSGSVFAISGLGQGVRVPPMKQSVARRAPHGAREGS
jgi:L-arabinonolactonase